MAWIGIESASNAAMVERTAFIEIPPTQISEEDHIVEAEGCKGDDAVFVIVSGFPQPTLSEASDHRCYLKREGSIYLAALSGLCRDTSPKQIIRVIATKFRRGDVIVGGPLTTDALKP
ncbi:hypothetical protein AB4874_19480, partial [Thioclava sp. 15-R06ZXC-3]